MPIKHWLESIRIVNHLNLFYEALDCYNWIQPILCFYYRLSMSGFLESAHLFPCCMCQTGVLAEFTLKCLHSGMGEGSLQYQRGKKNCRCWRVDLSFYIC